jgi:hypothetical protein
MTIKSTPESEASVTPVDITFPEAAVDSEPATVAPALPAAALETVAVDVMVSPVAPTVAEVLVGLVTVVRATGKREVRGEVRDVALPYFNVLIDGKLAARTSLNLGKPIMTVAEVLPEEEAAVIAAVKLTRGDTETLEVRRPPSSKAVEAFRK